MDEVGRLIEQFRSEKTRDLGDSSKKVGIINRLEEILEETGDERVLPFFLEVLADAREYDLARIEVLEILKLKDRGDMMTDQEIGRLIKNILVADQDDDVRSYAAMAASKYVDVEGILEELEKIIFDEDEDINIRWNAFASIEEMGPTEESKRIMEKALRVEEFKAYAQRVLDRWNST
jgi:hypothetical protein